MAKMAVKISAPLDFPLVTKNLPTKSCKAQEHIPNPYVNPIPSPWTRLIAIPYFNVSWREDAYECLANASFVNAYSVLMFDSACKERVSFSKYKNNQLEDHPRYVNSTPLQQHLQHEHTHLEGFPQIYEGKNLQSRLQHKLLDLLLMLQMQSASSL